MRYVNKRGIPGIPYFGEEHNSIDEHIKQLNVSDEVHYSSLYECVQKEKSVDKIVVIEDNGRTFLTYLRDIKFNYRDKKVFVPYYTFEVEEIKHRYLKSYKGHIINFGDGKIGIRYNYCFCEYVLDTEKNNSLILYDFEKDIKYKVFFDKYYDSDVFDMEYLYQLYIDYCKNYEDNIIYKHTEGYHIISREVERMSNIEKIFRERYNLNDYIESDVNIYYRDVRNLSENEYSIRIGLDLCNKPYWERRYDFESLLYCVIWNGSIPNNDFKKEWLKLLNGKAFVKYGDKAVKLIIKAYWFPKNNKYERKSWSRI